VEWCKENLFAKEIGAKATAQIIRRATWYSCIRAISFLYSSFPLTSGPKTRDSVSNHFRHAHRCKLNCAVKPNWQNSVISFVISKWLFPESLVSWPLVKGSEACGGEGGRGRDWHTYQCDSQPRSQGPLSSSLESFSSKREDPGNEVVWFTPYCGLIHDIRDFIACAVSQLCTRIFCW